MHKRPPPRFLSFTYPDTWRREIEEEVTHRVLHGLGGARITTVFRDAILAAPTSVAWLRPFRRLTDGSTVDHTITYGPTVLRALEQAELLEGFKKSEFARAALRYYLDLPRSARPRNQAGSDLHHDPLNPGAMGPSL